MSRRRSTLLVHLLSAVTATALATTVLAGPAEAAPAAASLAAPATTSLAAPATVRAGAPVATTGFRFVDVPGADVTLKANVIAPAAAGRYPAVILPSSWGLNDLEYLAQARALAGRGYVVVSYTPRGWWASGGEIDTAGPRDMADLSRVVDWTIAQTAADPARIGAAGISYGAGLSLLGSAFDRRIRAVAVMSGWTDLVHSLYGDSTRHRQSSGLLRLSADLLGNAGPELTERLGDFAAGRDLDEIVAWANVRSPATYLDAINANRPAVLIANAWNDSFFPPNQLADFYARLTTPKRLELRPGDHAIAEFTGVLGLENDVWTSVYRWFDQHLAGIDTGIGGEPPVLVKPHNAAREGYADWSALTSATRRYGLGQIRRLDRTGLLGGEPQAGWSKSLPTDLDTTANGGQVLVSNGIAAFTGRRPQIWLPTVDRGRAGVWASERPSTAQRIRGIPTLHLELGDTAARGTVMAYLYDLDALGNAQLITHAPVSWLGTEGGDRAVDVRLPATAYDLPAGHSLTLAVDTVDPLYYDENAPGGTVTVKGGSYLDVPLK
ncbi:CocE/NonD family hydrolase [Streptosporangium sp. NPDC050855]|uniref:CocE/NonD family hydrolase n=1 Tax=Streptosporangium sp. NPDC050855 TaxID=3366194 RepID=UPI0037AFECBF